MSRFSRIRRIVTSEGEPKTFNDEYKIYRLLHVSYLGSAARYAFLFALGDIGLPIIALNIVGGLFRNPYTGVVTPEGLIVGDLAAFFVAGGDFAFIIGWNRHKANELNGEKTGRFTLLLPTFNAQFHGWIRRIIPLPIGTKVQLIKEVTDGKIEHGPGRRLTDEEKVELTKPEWYVYAFDFNLQPINRILYATRAPTKEKIYSMKAGSVIHRGYWVGASTDDFQWGVIDSFVLFNPETNQPELVPLCVSAGDYFNYQLGLEAADTLRLTTKQTIAAAVSAQTSATIALAVENRALKKERIGYINAEHNIDELARKGAIALRRKERRAGEYETPERKPLLTNRQAIVIAVVVSAVIVVGIILSRVL